MWKFIWSHNGRIYVKKNETATGQHAFYNADDFSKFIERLKATWFPNAESSVSHDQVFQYGQTLMFDIVQTNVFELPDTGMLVSEFPFDALSNKNFLKETGAWVHDSASWH